MPESLSTGDLNRMKRLTPVDPYKRDIPMYSLFMGDVPTSNGGSEAIRIEAQTHPVTRLLANESVSKTYPYVFSRDDQWPLPAGWDQGYLSYYAADGEDNKGPYINKNDKKVNVPAGMVRSSFQISDRAWPSTGPSVPQPLPIGATTSYVSMSGLGALEMGKDIVVQNVVSPDGAMMPYTDDLYKRPLPVRTPPPVKIASLPPVLPPSQASQNLPAVGSIPVPQPTPIPPATNAVPPSTNGSWCVSGNMPDGTPYCYNFMTENAVSNYAQNVVNGGGSATIYNPAEVKSGIAPQPTAPVAPQTSNMTLGWLLAIPAAAYLYMRHK